MTFATKTTTINEGDWMETTTTIDLNQTLEDTAANPSSDVVNANLSFPWEVIPYLVNLCYVTTVIVSDVINANTSFKASITTTAYCLVNLYLLLNMSNYILLLLFIFGY